MPGCYGEMRLRQDRAFPAEKRVLRLCLRMTKNKVEALR